MIVECLDKKYEKIIEDYIGDNYYKCIYLYLDLKKYGFSNNNIKTWIQVKDNKEISTVILMYYTGMHVFSIKHDYDIKELCEFVKVKRPAMICGEKTIISNIYNNLDISDYNIELGWVRELDYIESFNRDGIEKAKEEDFYQIAKLLYDDEDLGSSYKLEELKNQMYERNKEKYVRNYIIRNEDEIICHAGTGAENEKVAMLSYVITNPKFRNKGYAKKLCSAVCEDLIKENKKVYLINYSTESTALYDKLGFKICSEWGKIFLNLKSN